MSTLEMVSCDACGNTLAADRDLAWFQLRLPKSPDDMWERIQYRHACSTSCLADLVASTVAAEGAEWPR